MTDLLRAESADGDVVARAALGEERAVAQLYDRYAPVVYAVACRIVAEHADAEEVVAETFAQAWRDAPRFDPTRGSAAAWLVTIARSRALDAVRARTRRDRVAPAAVARGDDAPGMGRTDSDPADLVDLGERQKRVRDALEVLPPSQRQAIELAYYEGLSQSEIAERIREPLGTVKTRVRLGMLKLRDSLRPYFLEAAE
ncbi:MAG: sigma-70 family RNA polymerase sigma factor [Gemmatimonadota bacterium]